MKSNRLAIARAKELFGADHANVQPHSGSQANMTVYLSVLKPGDSYLGMNLAHGGHLSMGSPVNFSGIHLSCHSLRRCQKKPKPSTTMKSNCSPKSIGRN